MNYGFLIDNSRCIGCHACSTACKSENQVPLGVNRTWVKSVETGVYPDARRHFQVSRCNHCANPPCVRICPTEAMFQRADGIVEFDGSACIGCKACLQACPYDAIYIDPETKTAAKCHFCAHRVELNLEPACVVVCPEHAILAGDMDDPTTEISRRLATADVTVRKPEQGTAPKLFYIEGNAALLTPTATAKPESYLWADVVQGHHQQPTGGGPSTPTDTGLGHATRRGRGGQDVRVGQPQGAPWRGPIQIGGGGRAAEQMVQLSYNAQHTVPWHWPVPAYLVTKGIGAGLFLLLGLALMLGWLPAAGPLLPIAAAVSVVFTAITAGLLVYDLEQPSRFLYILTRPQWRSWLTRGAFLLMGFSSVAGLWMLAEVAGALGWLDADSVAATRPWLLAAGAPLAVGAAIYTAFLFGQAEGRDLWQSPLLPLHLLVQAVMAGGAALLLIGLAVGAPDTLMGPAVGVFIGAVAVDLAMILLGEFGMPHASEVAARAAHDITHGRFARLFWVGAVVLGHVVPLIVATLGGAGAAAAAVLAIGGLYAFEYAFVMAPQHVPNS